ncbi:monocarboxylate transporter 11 [Nematostella vectensis]|nr:monocarboxylate transporter 11 [Nematostella vectensis]
MARKVDSAYSWVVCASCVLCNVLVMGTVLSFGVLYPAFLKDLGRSREKTAWIGSLPVSIMSVSAVVSGALCDKLGSRLTGYLGTVVCSAGLLLSSFAPEIWIVYLTYGLLLGVGTGLIFTSIFSITAKYFNRFRALAVGIVGSGEGLGILVMAPVIQLLLDALQLRNTLRVMAAMVLANTLVM